MSRPPSRPIVGDILMKSHTEYLTFDIPQRMGFLNITRRVEEIVAGSGVREGLVLVNRMQP